MPGRKVGGRSKGDDPTSGTCRRHRFKGNVKGKVQGERDGWRIYVTAATASILRSPRKEGDVGSVVKATGGKLRASRTDGGRVLKYLEVAFGWEVHTCWKWSLGKGYQRRYRLEVIWRRS